jgi:3-hydroxyisobutyrate dehydrogenase-like beta-hydroxyacid dehydrogenase
MATNTMTVSVLGLGPMGQALARALLTQGVPTTVWNRTASRAEALRDDGAGVATDPTSAVRAGDLVIVCQRDHAVAREVMGAVEPTAYEGRTVVNLTSATPAEARETAAWAQERGIRYLTGAIMVPTPLIGDPGALILYAGPSAEVERHRTTLEMLAGRVEHLGEDHGLAPLYDTAMLGVFFAGMTSFLHSAAVVGAHGVKAEDFLPYAGQMLEILPAAFAQLAGDVDRGSYPGHEDRVAMELAALEHVVATSQQSGVDARLPEVMRDLARRVVAAGDGDLGWSRVVEELRVA